MGWRWMGPSRYAPFFTVFFTPHTVTWGVSSRSLEHGFGVVMPKVRDAERVGTLESELRTCRDSRRQERCPYCTGRQWREDER